MTPTTASASIEQPAPANGETPASAPANGEAPASASKPPAPQSLARMDQGIHPIRSGRRNRIRHRHGALQPAPTRPAWHPCRPREHRQRRGCQHRDHLLVDHEPSVDLPRTHPRKRRTRGLPLLLCQPLRHRNHAILPAIQSPHSGIDLAAGRQYFRLRRGLCSGNGIPFRLLSLRRFHRKFNEISVDEASHPQPHAFRTPGVAG